MIRIKKGATMDIIVQKYGGTSVGNVDRVKSVAKRIVEEIKPNQGIVVVVSAQAGMTDDLLSKAKALGKMPNRRELDMLLSTGEQVSAAFLALALQELGQRAISFNGLQLEIKTTSDHFDAKVESIECEKIHHYLQKGYVVVVTGFQGVDKFGDITTLGRGGSDTTAVALGVALKAKEVEIYTDVEGVYTADPRIVKEAKKLFEITYSEMLELATAGAKVLHNRCVELAANYAIVLHLRSSFSKNIGTYVKGEVVEKTVICGIAHSLNEHEVKVTNISQKEISNIMRVLIEAGIIVDNIIQIECQNGYELKFMVGKNFSDECIALLTPMLPDAKLEKNEKFGKVTVVGMGIKSKGVVQKVLEILSNEKIKIYTLSSSEISVSCIIDAGECSRAVEALHKGVIVV